MIDPTIVNQDVLKYVLGMNANKPLPEIFSKIEAKARESHQPIVSNDAGLFLNLVTKLINARRIVEVGCNIGYSGMWFATALPPDGVLDTIEINREIAEIAESHFMEAGLSDNVYIHVGAALDVLPSLEGPYDILFIDAVKSQYIDYLKISLPKLRKGGLILVDNVLWSGKVANKEIDKEDKMTRALHEFNQFFSTHPDIDTTILTIGDGLGFGIKK